MIENYQMRVTFLGSGGIRLLNALERIAIEKMPARTSAPFWSKQGKNKKGGRSKY